MIYEPYIYIILTILFFPSALSHSKCRADFPHLSLASHVLQCVQLRWVGVYKAMLWEQVCSFIQWQMRFGNPWRLRFPSLRKNRCEDFEVALLQWRNKLIKCNKTHPIRMLLNLGKTAQNEAFFHTGSNLWKCGCCWIEKPFMLKNVVLPGVETGPLSSLWTKLFCDFNYCSINLGSMLCAGVSLCFVWHDSNCGGAQVYPDMPNIGRKASCPQE